MIARLLGRGKPRSAADSDAFEPEIEPASQLAPPKPGMLPTADYYLATLREGVTEINLSPRETTLMFTIPARIKDHASSLEHLSVVDQPSIRTIAPHQLRYLTRLRTLTLSGLKIHTLPDALGEIASTLTSIDLSNDTFSEVPPVLCKLTELKSLNLSDNELGDVPHEIEALHNLEAPPLEERSPRVPERHRPTPSAWPASGPGCPLTRNGPQLRVLELYGNRLRSVPDTIKLLSGSLQVIGLWGNGIRRLPEGIFDLENLEVLSLSSCALTRLPAAIGNLKQLRVLDLEWNGLASLPPAMSALQKLRVLRLGHNFFSHVPAAVHAMSELREFTCTGNEVETLTYGLSGKAMDIASMERAESAAVARERSERARFTPIRGLSGWIGEAGGEDKVGGTGKGEGDDEEEGFQETGGGSGSDSRSEEGRATDEEADRPDTVSALDLGGATVVGEATTPRHVAGAAVVTRESAGDLQSGSALYLDWVRERQSGADNPWSLLAVLDLSSNRLEGLHYVGPLLNLRHLDLSDNNLVGVPPAIGKLAALEELNLRQNRLVQLPREIGQLLRLRVLRLSGRDQQLEALPLEICGLGESLTVLEPCESLQSPPAEVVRQGMETVVTWFRERAHRLQQEVLEARGEQFAEDRESALDEATQAQQWWQLEMPQAAGLDGAMMPQTPTEKVSLSRAQAARWGGDVFEAETALRKGTASGAAARLRAGVAPAAVSAPTSELHGEAESQGGSDTRSEFSLQSIDAGAAPAHVLDMAEDAAGGEEEVGREEADPDATAGIGGWVMGLFGGEGGAGKGSDADGQRNNP